MFVSPIKTNRITSGYGPRNGKFHFGVDIGADHGVECYAVCDGIAVNKYDEYLGNYVKLYFSEADYKKGYKGSFVKYAHLSNFCCDKDEAFEEDEPFKISKGDVIGYVGSSGKSNGPHLHFELHIPAEDAITPDHEFYKGRGHNCVDPLKYIPFELHGALINPNCYFNNWQTKSGFDDLLKLDNNEIVSTKAWLNTLKEPVPQWLFWMIVNRLFDRLGG